MKFKTLLIFIVVLFFVSAIIAQPVRYLVFNPTDLCKYKEGKTIFVGRVISIEMVSKDALPEVFKKANGQLVKHTISVEKVFRGQIKPREIKEILLVKDLEPRLSVNDEIIFIYDETKQIYSKFLTNIEWSSPLNNYSGEEKAIRFSQIEAIINRYPKSPTLNGIVLQTDDTPKYSFEIDIIYGYEYRNYKPIAGVTVLAKSKSSNRVFRVKTNEKRKFTFDKLDEGDYVISIVIPKGFEQVFRYEQYKDYDLDVSINKNICGGPGRVFRIKKRN